MTRTTSPSGVSSVRWCAPKPAPDGIRTDEIFHIFLGMELPVRVRGVFSICLKPSRGSWRHDDYHQRPRMQDRCRAQSSRYTVRGAAGLAYVASGVEARSCGGVPGSCSSAISAGPDAARANGAHDDQPICWPHAAPVCLCAANAHIWVGPMGLCAVVYP